MIVSRNCRQLRFRIHMVKIREGYILSSLRINAISNHVHMFHGRTPISSVKQGFVENVPSIQSSGQCTNHALVSGRIPASKRSHIARSIGSVSRLPMAIMAIAVHCEEKTLRKIQCWHWRIRKTLPAKSATIISTTHS